MISRLQIDRTDAWSAFLQVACLLAIAVALGAAVTFSPLLGGVIAVLALGVGMLTLEQRLITLFLIAMYVGLAGYMFFGRGFAYAGMPPLYVGELLFGLAALTLAYTFSLRQFTFLHILIVLFIVWGFLRTAPYISTYGIDALRDGVVWAYAIFALALSNVVTVRFFERTANGLARLLPVFLVWIPMVAVLDLLKVIPVWPQSGVPVAIFKAGDMAVHLAGLAAFVICGMYYSHQPANRRLPSSLFWILVIAGFVFVAAINRGGLLTMVAGIGMAFYLWPTRQLFSFLSVVAVVGTLVVILNPNLEIPGVSRQIGPQQIIRNVVSIVDTSETGGEAGLQATRNWREQWWETVWDYTVQGPYFLTGKGYGVNLSDVDGFQTVSDGSSRSPHNGHVTILARSGVPGLAIWLLIQVLFGYAIYRALLRARAAGALFWAQVDTCILIYWIALLINMSFDVYLEGPQGGIWYWSVLGVGLAALRLQEESLEAPRFIHPRLRRSQ